MFFARSYSVKLSGRNIDAGGNRHYKGNNMKRINEFFEQHIETILVLSPFIAMFIWTVVVFGFVSSEEKAEREAVKVARQVEAENRTINGAISIASTMTYVRDDRTGICFAYYNVYRNFSLATVDCELLNNVEILEK